MCLRCFAFKRSKFEYFPKTISFQNKVKTLCFKGCQSQTLGLYLKHETKTLSPYSLNSQTNSRTKTDSFSNIHPSIFSGCSSMSRAMGCAGGTWTAGGTVLSVRRRTPVLVCSSPLVRARALAWPSVLAWKDAARSPCISWTKGPAWKWGLH